MITKMDRIKKKWVNKGNGISGEFENSCKSEGMQIYSTMIETKAAFAGRGKRSLKIILYRYMENFG